jgi:hypothetical protein
MDASRTAAAAKIRAGLFGGRGEAAGMDHRRLARHLMMPMAGVSSASTSSTTIESILVSWPVASSVILKMDLALR